MSHDLSGPRRMADGVDPAFTSTRGATASSSEALPGDPIRVRWPAQPHRALEPV